MHTLNIFAQQLPPPAQRYVRSIAPTAKPISLEVAKSFLRVDHDDDNDDIQRFIDAAICYLDGSGLERDGQLGRALINQMWILEAERPERGRIAIEYGTVQSIVSVEVMSAGSYATWDSTNYRLGRRDGQAFITPVTGQSFPQHDCREDAFKITYLCGYGPAATDIPASLIEAMLLHVGHLYENRQGIYAEARGQALTLPMGYMDHLVNFRVIPTI
jgi:uncharacterized phiE125 gp8 family phage protein